MATVLNDTTNAQFIPTIISQKCLQKFGSYLNLAKTVSRDTDYSTAGVGAILSIPKTGAVSANDKVAGSNFTYQAPTATNVTVTLDKHKEVTVLIDDVTKVLENQDSQERYANDMAIALAEAVESSLLGLHTSMQNTITWSRSSAATIDSSMLLIRKFFTDQKVPALEERHMYVDATIFNDLLGTDKFSRYDARGTGSAIETGRVLRAYGLTIHESQLVPVTGSPVAYHSLAYTKDALILASRPLPKPAPGTGAVGVVVTDPEVNITVRTLFSYDPDLGAHKLTMDLLYGVAILDQRRVVEIESF